jgi:hypothetical protein
VLFAFVCFFVAFSNMKDAMQSFRPFAFDAACESLDRQLHFGSDPWRLLQPLLGSPPITIALDFCYYAWFPIMYGTLVWQIFTRDDRDLRMRFLLAFAAAWILVGTILATLFSSAGPIFQDLLSGPGNAYSPLCEYLQSVSGGFPLKTLTVRELLWSAYVEDLGTTPVKGISAMPSMHVTVTVLLYLFARHKSRALSVAYGIFALLILVGSVHLGWHYAIDGYVGAVLALLIWWAVGAALNGPVHRKRIAGAWNRPAKA